MAIRGGAHSPAGRPGLVLQIQVLRTCAAIPLWSQCFWKKMKPLHHTVGLFFYSYRNVKVRSLLTGANMKVLHNVCGKESRLISKDTHTRKHMHSFKHKYIEYLQKIHKNACCNTKHGFKNSLIPEIPCNSIFPQTFWSALPCNYDIDGSKAQSQIQEWSNWFPRLL